MIQFGILGPLEVLVAGEPVALGGPRQRAVLARLLLSPARAVTADLLIEDVWNGRPPPSAPKVLQKYVSELRRMLPAQTLRTVGGGYALDVEAEWVDVCRFERLVDERRYAAGLALWRGDVLSDLPDLAFLVPERARLDELRLFAVESRLEADLAAGRHGEVLGQLAELADAYPLRERVIRMLMLALYRAGRQVEALRAFGRHRRLLVEEVGVDPAAEVRELEAAILRHDPELDLPPAPVVRGNLSRALTSFVGRLDELDSVERAIADNRLVTLTGPGGVGKTRLAIELGSRIADQFAGGVWVVDLAALQAPDLVAGTVATALDVDTRHAPDDLAAVAAALAHRGHCLLVLDNCEHVIDPVAALVVAVMRTGAGVHLLATSRRPLGVDAEFVRPLRPLPETDAVRLFSDRARLASGGGATIADGDASEICRQVDGLPLAIELAASQLRVLDAAEIIARLGDQLTFRGRDAGAPPRQRTLGDMVRWSYDLLPTAVQVAFARLGVFASSLSLPAAEAVCAPDGTARSDVLGQITTLVDHSLLVRDYAAVPSSRYRLLATLRLFAIERLAEASDGESAHPAHAEYFLELAAEGGPQLYGPDERSWRDRLELEEANFHAALAWAASNDPELALRLAVALWPYWDARWREREGVEVVEAVLRRDLTLPDDLRAWGLTASAAMSGNSGEARHTTPRALGAVAAFRKLADDRGLGEALAALGMALGNEGRLDDADRALSEGLAIARRLGDLLLVARLLDRLGFVAGRRGDHALAVEINREELAVLRTLGSRRGEATALRHLAISLRHLGADDEAAALCHRALDIWRELDDPAAAAHVQTTLADIARVRGDHTGAVRIYNAALVDLLAIGDRRCTASTYKNLASIAAERGESGRASELFKEGLALRHELGDEAGLAEVLEGLAGVSSADGYDEDAATLSGAATAVRERTGSAASCSDAEHVRLLLEQGIGRIGADRVDAGVRRGRSMSAADVVAFVLGA